MGGTLSTRTTPLGTAEPGGPATARVIDAHQHYWRFGEADQSAWRTPAHRAIERDYLPADLAPELAACSVDATVLMQSVDEPAENDRLSDYARAAGTVAGVVGWLPLADPARRPRRVEPRRHPRLVRSENPDRSRPAGLAGRPGGRGAVR